jgi:hypothetical protein
MKHEKHTWNSIKGRYGGLTGITWFEGVGKTSF